MECSFDATTGVGTVPKALLAGLTGAGALEYVQSAQTVANVGSFSITGLITQIGGVNIVYQ